MAKDVINQIVNILFETTNNNMDTVKIDQDTNLIEDLGLDSLQTINFVLLLEDEFDIEIDFEEIEYEMFQKLSTLIEYIEEKLKGV